MDLEDIIDKFEYDNEIDKKIFKEIILEEDEDETS